MDHQTSKRIADASMQMPADATTVAAAILSAQCGCVDMSALTDAFNLGDAGVVFSELATLVHRYNRRLWYVAAKAADGEEGLGAAVAALDRSNRDAISSAGAV